MKKPWKGLYYGRDLDLSRLETTIPTQYASAVTGAIGSLTSVASKLGWKIMVWYQVVLASHPVYGCCLYDFAAFYSRDPSATNSKKVSKNARQIFYRAHFLSGIECHHLYTVWDSSTSWETLARQYD